MNVIIKGAKMHCTPVSQRFQDLGTMASSSASGWNNSEAPSGRGDTNVVGESEGSLISPSTSDCSVSTTGSVIVKQNTAGRAIIDRIL
jgi:hypothetical protein